MTGQKAGNSHVPSKTSVKAGIFKTAKLPTKSSLSRALELVEHIYLSYVQESLECVSQDNCLCSNTFSWSNIFFADVDTTMKTL